MPAVWDIAEAVGYQKRLARFMRDHPQEMQSMLNRLQDYHRLLQAFDNPLHPGLIACGFVHSERRNLFAIGQERTESSKESRLYVYPDKATRTLVLLTVGTHDTEPDDINWCHKYMEK